MQKEINEEKRNLSSKEKDVLLERGLLDLPEDHIHRVYIQSLNEILEMQKKNIKDMYNAGLYNGLALAYAMAIGEEPKFVDIKMIGGN